MRYFGQQDPVSKDHAGPEVRWARQARRQLKRAQAAMAKYPASNPIHQAAAVRAGKLGTFLAKAA